MKLSHLHIIAVIATFLTIIHLIIYQILQRLDSLLLGGILYSNTLKISKRKR